MYIMLQYYRYTNNDKTMSCSLFAYCYIIGFFFSYKKDACEKFYCKSCLKDNDILESDWAYILVMIADCRCKQCIFYESCHFFILISNVEYLEINYNDFILDFTVSSPVANSLSSSEVCVKFTTIETLRFLCLNERNVNLIPIPKKMQSLYYHNLYSVLLQLLANKSVELA